MPLTPFVIAPKWGANRKWLDVRQRKNARPTPLLLSKADCVGVVIQDLTRLLC